MVQAENDNDRMAIAALLKSVESDASNLEAALQPAPPALTLSLPPGGPP